MIRYFSPISPRNCLEFAFCGVSLWTLLRRSEKGRKGVDRQIVNIYPDTLDLPDSWYLPYRDEIAFGGKVAGIGI